MTSVYLSLAQGAIAGGTSSYLSNRIEKKTDDLWGVVALEVNHLLLLTAETICFAGGSLGKFGLFVKSSFVVLPLLVGAALCKRKITVFDKECADKLNTFYRVGVMVVSLAAALLGNPAFAISSLSLLAINMYLEEKKNTRLLSLFHSSAAFLACLNYTAQAFVASGTFALIARVSSVATWAIFCLQDPLRFYLHRELLKRENLDQKCDVLSFTQNRLGEVAFTR